MEAKDVVFELQKHANAKKAKISASFFKTAPGQYGAGDEFIGVTVPQQRDVAKKYVLLSLPEILRLLQSKFHEHRLTALLILVAQFESAGTQTQRSAIVEFYLKNRQHINNWDLVDSTARQILGTWLLNQEPSILYHFARSNKLWERRIAIIATHAFIYQGKFEHTCKISTILLNDKEDLIHKACGWMLREMGKRDEKMLLKYLDVYAHVMPRTMLRYAIERLTPALKKKYMTLKDN